MSTTFRPEDFRLSPEELAAMKEQPAAKPIPRKSKKEIEFYQFPKTVLDELTSRNYMPALLVAMAVYKGWYEDFKKRNPVKLTSRLLAEFGLSKDQKFRALKVLDGTTHFLVERFPRRNPMVTMKWKLIKELKSVA
jgi:hypothetical protein